MSHRLDVKIRHVEGRPRPATHDGFTIIELIIVVAIGAILAAIAVPSMRVTLNTMRQSSALRLLVSDLNQARGEAIKRNTGMLVCRRDPNDLTSTECSVDPSAVAPFDWHAGWVVCVQDGSTNQCALATADSPNPQVVRPPVEPTLTLMAPVQVVRFSPNSSARDAANLSLGGTWTDAPTRTIAVAITGNISTP